MAAEDIRELIPRVRRAVEGPAADMDGLGPGALTDNQVLALVADSISDVILLTAGEWGHTLAISGRSDGETGFPTEWTVTPALSLGEEAMVAAQAALTAFYHTVRDKKTSERITNEGVEWEWSKSANTLLEQLRALRDQRDAALAALIRAHPALARYASFLEVRDSVGFAQLEPWAYALGGQVMTPGGQVIP